eukprot:COSAG01_NODE_61960_length_287_cov_0.537234_1_plen_63_part_01
MNHSTQDAAIELPVHTCKTRKTQTQTPSLSGEHDEGGQGGHVRAQWERAVGEEEGEQRGGGGG